MEGTFGKAFRSGIEPVEIGRKVDARARRRPPDGRPRRPVAPNNIGVYLAPADFERFESFADALARELAEVAREHAKAEGYHFVGPRHRHARRRRRAAGRASATSPPRSTRAPESGRSSCPTADGCPLGERDHDLGRMPDCDIVVADPHGVAAGTPRSGPPGNGFLLVDLESDERHAW